LRSQQLLRSALPPEPFHRTSCTLKQLSSDRAEALILCFFSGLDFREAGEVLGKSEAAIKMLISRGLQDLRTRSSIILEVDHE
jgi:DNA-directed RNA polymerase specialized sigma24 family protein